MQADFASQPNTGGGVQHSKSISASKPWGSARGVFSVMPPPVMCAKPLTPPAWSAASSAFHVKPCRRQQCIAQRELPARKERAHRKQVRFAPRRGARANKPFECTPEDATPINTSPARISVVFGKIEPRSTAPTENPARSKSPFGIEAGHFGRFAADQRATAFPAGARNTFDDRRGIVHVQLGARVVIEKEQRFRALHHDVVDAHRHQVLADAAERSRVDGDFKLRADAVCGGHQHRIGETGSLQIEQSAETAQIRIRAGAPRRLRSGCDSVDEFLAGVDVDTGFFISEAVTP